jgi:RHS repeat-associated protein
VIEQRNSDNQTTQQKVYSPVYVDSLVLWDRDTDANGTLDQRLYYQQDANFNVTSVTDDTGAVVQRFVYDPYGTKTTLNADWTTVTGTDLYGIMEGHQGGTFDPATGLYYFRFRYLNPDLGRWLSQDPLGYVDGANRYVPLLSNPLVNLDPSGEAVYIVMRQFNSDDPRERASYAKRFRCCGRLAHGYIVLTDDDNQVERTFSWHPERFKAKSLKTAFSQSGRVWENHPADRDPISAGLAYQEFLVTDNVQLQQRLEQEIDSFIRNSGAGYERGASRPDGPNNSIGQEAHRTAKRGAMTYELFGDNCVSWSVLMLDRAGLRPPKGVAEFNFGVFNRPGGDKPHLRGTGAKAHLR